LFSKKRSKVTRIFNGMFTSKD